MRILKLIVACLALAFCSVGTAAAQSAEAVQHEMSAMAAWSTAATQAFNSALEPLAAMPSPPANMSDKPTTSAWIAASRAWLVDARGAVARSRADFAALPPPPVVSIVPGMTAVLTEQRRRFPLLLGNLGAFYDRYEQALAALERNDASATVAIAISSIDAISLTVANMRDVNDMTAAGLPAQHPQAFWLRSVARSYDAMLSYITMTKEGLQRPGPPSGFQLEAMRDALASMRQEIVGGRQAYLSARQSLRTTTANSDAERSVLEKTRRAIDTYEGSFGREETILAELSALSAHISVPGRGFNPEDPNVTRRMERASTLDIERLNDQSARLAILSGP